MEAVENEQTSSTVIVHLDAQLRAEIEVYSEKAGESLDAFIGEASAALLDRRKADEWYKKTRQSTSEGRAWAIDLLNRPSGNPPLPGDELPDGHTG